MNDRKHDIEIEIDAPAELVWKTITEGQGLTRWFAPEAEVKPGPDGSVRLSWGPGMEGTAPITVWEPGRRVAWTENNGGRPKVVEFIVEGTGGKTRLRMVHSGFGAEANFDAEYESTHGGWNMFLTMLRHGLERFPTEPAEQICKFGMAPTPQPELAPKLNEQFGAGPLAEGGTFRLDFDGEELSGTVLRMPRPGYVCLAVDQWNGSILGLFVERAGPKSIVTVQAILFGEARRVAAGLETRIAGFLARFGA